LQCPLDALGFELARLLVELGDALGTGFGLRGDAGLRVGIRAGEEV